MYEEFFGLKRSPFRITPDTSLFYDGGRRGDILGALVYAVHRGEGIIKVVGEVGSGKTMLCRMLQQELPDSVEIIYIANPSVSPEDILFVIANELKFDIARDASKHEVVTMLQNYLLKKHAEDKQVVLFVEEAQSMPLETLEEIRLLSNLETDQYKLLQIILFGQPELDQNLATNSIRQLRERITHDFNLNPLNTRDIHQYLNFRMREVGYKGPELISLKLAAGMEKYSEGLLRRINILADKMLLSAFAGGTHTLTRRHLRAAVKDSGFSRIRAAGFGNQLFWFSALMLLLFLLGYLIISQQSALSVVWKDAQTLWSGSSQTVASVTQPTEVAEQSLISTEKSLASLELLTEVEPSAEHESDQLLALKQQENSKLQRVLASAEQVKKPVVDQELAVSSKKNQQSVDKLDKVIVNQPVEAPSSSEKLDQYQLWLNHKIEASKEWLRDANKQSVSIQVMMRSKSAARELVRYLQTEWPLELDKTYIYEVKMKDRAIYRVFYNEYPSITLGQISMKQLPESVRINSPYLHSVYRMQKALL
ncbi:MAG: AAA family ATPase [Gammaproteobacteria bacterium]|nr:AAA family ATPase [Gammaproteobacteria bacterium]